MFAGVTDFIMCRVSDRMHNCNPFQVVLICRAHMSGLSLQDTPQLGVKTLSGREINRDRLQSNEGWSNFTAGFFVGAESGVAWAYVLTQILPYYQ